MELVSVYNNILQVILLLNNLCKDCLEILGKEKCLEKRKKRALQKTLAKDAKKCRNISDMFKRSVVDAAGLTG